MICIVGCDRHWKLQHSRYKSTCSTQTYRHRTQRFHKPLRGQADLSPATLLFGGGRGGGGGGTLADLCLQGSIHLPTVEHCKQRSSTTGTLRRRTRRRTRGRTSKREWSPALHDHVKDAFGFVNGQCPYLQTCLGKKYPK